MADSMPTQKPANRAFRLIVLTVMIGAIMAVHYMTPATMAHTVIHDLHRQILYIPIILAAFWFGWRGGLFSALAISALFFPHLVNMAQSGCQMMMMDHASDSTELVNRIFEMIIFLTVGGITGLLVDKLRREESRLLAANAVLGSRTTDLQKAMDDLKSRTREVFEAEEQLRRADRLSAIGQLTTSLAHEIRNPLASIRGTAEILGDSGIGEAQRIEFSRILLEETQRLDRVLGNFLDYAGTQKNGNGNKAASSLPRVMDKIKALLGRPLADAHVELTTDIPEDLPLLGINEDLLQQSILNLALNAVQAMKDRGGKLAIQARRDANNITIHVSDTGPGIPEALAGKIFDPFFTTKPQGLGLGLAIVYKIVTGSAGRIELESAKDAQPGASFRITLPVAV